MKSPPADDHPVHPNNPSDPSDPLANASEAEMGVRLTRAQAELAALSKRFLPIAERLVREDTGDAFLFASKIRDALVRAHQDGEREALADFGRRFNALLAKKEDAETKRKEGRRPRPYVGISGVMGPEEATALVQMFDAMDTANAARSTHDLMLGVLVSEKTLRGDRNKWHRRYPAISEIQAIFDAVWSVGPDKPVNLIHYASDTPPTLETLIELSRLGFPSLSGFQFNGAWPNATTLNAFALHRGDRGDYRIVLQVRVPPTATNVIVGMLEIYAAKKGATDVLIDASGGRGKPIDIGLARRIHDAIESSYPDRFTIGFAGGLASDTLTDEAGDLLRQGLSIDAEGRLRDDADGGGNLDLKKAAAYLQRTIHLFNQGDRHEGDECNR